MLTLPDAHPPRPVRVRPVRTVAPPKKVPPKGKPPIVVKPEANPIIAPVRTVGATEEVAALGVALSVPLASKLLSFMHIQGSIQALVPVVADKDIFDATLTARRRPETAVEADLAIDMRAGDFHFALGVGHGLRRGLGLSFFALFSYRPTRDDEPSDPRPELLVIQKAPPTPQKPTR